MKRFILFLCLFGIASCTDAQLAKFSSLGDPSRITCYSGEKLIFDACSTGKVSSSESSDGYYFNESTTNNLVEVSGNCIITIANPESSMK